MASGGVDHSVEELRQLPFGQMLRLLDQTQYRLIIEPARVTPWVPPLVNVNAADLPLQTYKEDQKAYVRLSSDVDRQIIEQPSDDSDDSSWPDSFHADPMPEEFNE